MAVAVHPFDCTVLWAPELQGEYPAMTPRARPELIRLTRRFQEAVLNHRSHLSPALRAFPHPESERVAACTFALILEHAGYEVTVLALPESQLPALVWVLAGKYHVQPNVIRGKNRLPAVSVSRPRARERAMPELLPPLEGEAQRAAQEDAAFLLGIVGREVPALRFQPWREVVDVWEGVDVLSCGHLLAPNTSYGSPHQRRCAWCEPGLPARVYRVVGEDADLSWFAGLSDCERGRVIRRWRLVALQGQVSGSVE